MIKNEYGFTLVETMFSLFLFSIVIFMFPFILSFFKPAAFETLKVKEVELFFMQISREIHGAKSMSIQGRQLIVELHNGDKASYEHYNNLIRRRLNEKGHEILLQHIQSVHFQLEQQLVTIQITGERGERFERKLALIGEDRET